MKHFFYIIICFAFTFNITAQVTISATNVKCKGANDGSLSVTVQNATLPIKSYAWSDGGSSSSTRNKVAAGNYCVTITDNANCTGTACKTVEEPASKLKMDLVVTADPTISVRCGERQPVIVTKYVSGGVAPYLGGATEVLRVAASGKFHFFASDAAGCNIDEDVYALVMALDCPGDPNDITGEIGIKAEHWVSIKDTLDYRVRFENDSTLATSPAQRVFVEVPLHPNADQKSFRLGDFGFRNLVFSVPDNIPFYQTRLDLTAESGVLLDVIAGINIQTNKAFWIFESIDPATGLIPLNPQVGFLPINNSLGDGEGFVNFSIKPKSSNVTGNIINEQGNIVFDVEQNIQTNVWSNKIDALPPVTIVSPLPDSTELSSINIHFNSTDDIGGVGVSHSILYYSMDNQFYQIYQNFITSDSITFIGNQGEDYYFKIVSVDSVGNMEVKNAFDSHIFIKEIPSIEIINNYQNQYCKNEDITFDIKVKRISKIDVLVQNLTNGISTLVLNNIDSSTFPLNIIIHDSLLNNPIKLIFKNHYAVESDTTAALIVYSLPTLIGSNDTTLCPSEPILLQESGASTYRWYNYYNVQLSTNPFLMVSTENNTYFRVVGTDFNGCSKSDTININVNPTYLDTTIVELCQGDSVFINGDWVDTLGYYPTEYSNQYGCDSIIVSKVEYQNPCIWSGGPYVYVNDNATGANTGVGWVNAFTDLQDALYVAGRYENVQEIWVAEGTYQPDLSRRDTSFVLKDSIKVFGGFLGTENFKNERTNNAALVKLSGDINIVDTLWDNSYHTIYTKNTCVECVIDGVTVTYGYANNTSGMNDLGAGVLNFGKVDFNNVIFERNTATNIGAALYSNGNTAQIKISNCTFQLNSSNMGKDIVNINGANIEFNGLNMVKE